MNDQAAVSAAGSAGAEHDPAAGSAPAPPSRTRGAPLRRGLVIATSGIVLAGAALFGVGLWQLLAADEVSAGAERRAVEQFGSEREAPPAAEPSAISIPAIGFSAPVREFAVGDRTVLYPPTDDEAHWISDYGLPGAGSDNTVYLIGHTSADGRAVFDPLVDRAAQQTTVLPGDEILVDTASGTAVYEVIVTERHDKTVLSELQNVWTNVPDRLVLITCFFNAENDAAPDNMVLFARLIGGADEAAETAA